MSDSKVAAGTVGLPPATAHTTASSLSSADPSLPINNSPSTAESAGAPHRSSDEANSAASESQPSTISEAPKWYHDPHWVYARPQFERMLETGEFSFLVWKRKLGPDLRDYLLPVHLTKVLPRLPLPPTNPGDTITEEEVHNTDLLCEITKEYALQTKKLAALAEKRYEEYHGHPCPPKPSAASTAPASQDSPQGPSDAPGPTSGTQRQDHVAGEQEGPLSGQHQEEGEGREEEEEAGRG